MSLSCGGDSLTPPGRLACCRLQLAHPCRDAARMQDAGHPGQDSQDMQGTPLRNTITLASLGLLAALTLARELAFLFCLLCIAHHLYCPHLAPAHRSSPRPHHRLADSPAAAFHPPPTASIPSRHRPYPSFRSQSNANDQDLCAIIATCTLPWLSLGPTEHTPLTKNPSRYTSRLQRPPLDFTDSTSLTTLQQQQSDRA